MHSSVPQVNCSTKLLTRRPADSLYKLGDSAAAGTTAVHCAVSVYDSTFTEITPAGQPTGPGRWATPPRPGPPLCMSQP